MLAAGEERLVVLDGEPSLARLADLPGRVSDVLCKVQFGGNPPKDLLVLAVRCG